MTANIVRAFPAPSERLQKTTRFGAPIDPSELSFIMEAHDGLSARMVEEAPDLARARNLL